MKDNILIKKMLSTIKQHNMIKKNDRIIIGVSGGADSVALLRALSALREDYNLDLVVCHVNHKMRPGSAERDQEFVEALCAKLGVKCATKISNVSRLATEWGVSDEEAGRKVRYEFFNEMAGPGGKIATAHNKNDNVETVLMRFMRGTGLKGLTGIPYCRDNIIRPLLDISRAEIEQFLSDINQDHITDETNLEPIYTRNKIRLNLIPEIQKEFNPNFIETLSNNIGNYSDEEDYMNQQAHKALKCDFSFYNDAFHIHKGIFIMEHPAIIKRAVKLAFSKTFGVELSSQAINNIVDLNNKHSGTKMTVVDEIVATVQYSNIIIQKGSPDKIMCEFNLDTGVDKPVVFHTNNLSISYEPVVGNDVVNTAATFYLPKNLAGSRLTFRTRRDGDIVVLEPGLRKKLKKFFIDNKIDAHKRDNYWLLVNEKNEIVWIPKLFGSRLNQEDRSGEMLKFTIVK